MRWTEADLRAYEDRVARKLCSPQPQPAVCYEPLGQAQGEAPVSNRIGICITGFRRRLLDPDNFAGGCKYLIDGLRYSQLLHDDTQEQVSLTFQQVKVQTKQEEETLIEIEL